MRPRHWGLAHRAAQPRSTAPADSGSARPVTLLLCGDVMTGRGIDQILPHPSDPRLFEPYVRSALDYVELAERASGAIPRRAGADYPWGDALAELGRRAPDARIVNLETAVTTSDAPWPHKSIHYRMHPANVACLQAAAIDCCVLANNHVLDWGREGLAETIAVLHQAGMHTAGAGSDREQAAAPACIALSADARILVFGFATTSSGVPPGWAASAGCSGVNLLQDLSDGQVEAIAAAVQRQRRAGDIVVASIHWGPNWGYESAPERRRFAHRLIETAGVDLVHGHSSHHVQGIEVHRGRLILYGCGDLLNDYEGIGGYEAYRGNLSLLYCAALEAGTGGLLGLSMTPMRMRRFRIGRAGPDEAAWLRGMLCREGRALGTRAELQADGTLALRWGG